eukprot:m.276544 g.276544  ORF g.276544 m.276544 type:complete len:56 (+) comp40605_c0_seq43:208-375(+)
MGRATASQQLVLATIGPGASEAFRRHVRLRSTHKRRSKLPQRREACTTTGGRLAR